MSSVVVGLELPRTVSLHTAPLDSAHLISLSSTVMDASFINTAADPSDVDMEFIPKLKKSWTYSLSTNIFHETMGTFLFVYSILAVATTAKSTTDVAFAISTAAFVYSHVFNKAHFNTWITVYLFFTDVLGRRFDSELLELYPEQYRGLRAVPRDSPKAVKLMSVVHLVCQLIGSTAAAWLVYQFPLSSDSNMGNTNVAAGFLNSSLNGTSRNGMFVAMLLEFFLTYALLYSLDIGGAENHRPGRSKQVFFSVGPPLVLFLGVRTVGDFTGASFNFARALGPALITGEWGNGALGFYSIAHILAVGLALIVENERFKRHIRKRRAELQLLEEKKARSVRVNGQL